MTPTTGGTNTLRMGRPPTYTPEMDAIILSNRSTEEINRLFEEMGQGTRSPGAITQRRQYLKKHGGREPDYSDMDAAQRLVRLAERRAVLRKEIEAIEEQLAIKRRAMEVLRANLAATADEVSHDSPSSSTDGSS